MSEFGETLAPRQFESLSAHEKVSVILGAVRHPVSKEFALQLAGIDLNGLNDTERTTVEGVFVNPDAEGKYMAPEMKTKLPDVDWMSAEKQIADNLYESLFGEDELEP